MRRYQQLVVLIHLAKPKTIIEIGVHQGHRAALMAKAALQHGQVKYVGYDVFDTLGEQFQEEAYNGKGMVTEAEARETLDAIEGDFSYSLIVGDTRETLHGQDIRADFVFIDGDHRVDAIRKDYEAVQHSELVVFDDYYQDGPDTSLVGCNNAIVNLDYVLLPVKDAVIYGGTTQLAVVGS